MAYEIIGQKENQIVIIKYLASKLNFDRYWFDMPQDFCGGCTPYETVTVGNGQLIIEWLEIRLGIRQGTGF